MENPKQRKNQNGLTATKANSFECYIENIDICSINQKFTKNFALSRRYRASLAALMYSFKSFIKPGWIPLEGNLRMVMKCWSYLDDDNYEKIIKDALQHAEVIGNDRDFIHTDKTKIPIKKGRLNKLELKITRMEDQDEGNGIT